MQNVLGAVCSRYSARVRSYLIKKRIAYVERVPTLWTYNITIARRFDDAAVPVLITPEGEWIADSEIILDRLEARFPNEPILPPDPVHALFTTLADVWASEFWQQVDVATRWLGRAASLVVRGARRGDVVWFPEAHEECARGQRRAKDSGAPSAPRRYRANQAADLALGAADNGRARCCLASRALERSS